MENDRYQQILKEQRNWIAQKEAIKKKIVKEYEGGTITTSAVNSTWADMTIKRCEELIEYLK